MSFLSRKSSKISPNESQLESSISELKKSKISEKKDQSFQKQEDSKIMESKESNLSRMLEPKETIRSKQTDSKDNLKIKVDPKLKSTSQIIQPIQEEKIETKKKKQIIVRKKVQYYENEIQEDFENLKKQNEQFLSGEQTCNQVFETSVSPKTKQHFFLAKKLDHLTPDIQKGPEYSYEPSLFLSPEPTLLHSTRLAGIKKHDILCEGAEGPKFDRNGRLIKWSIVGPYDRFKKTYNILQEQVQKESQEQQIQEQILVDVRPSQSSTSKATGKQFALPLISDELVEDPVELVYKRIEDFKNTKQKSRENFDRALKQMQYTQQIITTKQQRILEKYSQHKQFWRNITEKFAQKVNKPNESVLIQTGLEHRRKIEEQDWLEKEVPPQLKAGKQWFQFYLRNQQKIYTRVYPDLYAPMKLRSDSIKTIIRRPPSRPTNETGFNTTRGIKKFTDSLYFQQRIATRPQKPVNVSECENLVLQGQNQFNKELQCAQLIGLEKVDMNQLEVYSETQCGKMAKQIRSQQRRQRIEQAKKLRKYVNEEEQESPSIQSPRKSSSISIKKPKYYGIDEKLFRKPPTEEEVFAEQYDNKMIVC